MPDIRAYLLQTFERAGGAISFEDFMALALYDSEIGYYSTQIGEVGGARGDFATSATLTPALGSAVSKWIDEEIAFFDWKGKIDVIEVGGGNGALAESILKKKGFFGRRGIRYHIVDVSKPLIALQEKRLKRFPIQWHEDLQSALSAVGGKALIFSNELVDAFPAKWLCWNGENWNEVWVTFDIESGLREEFRFIDTDQSQYSASSLLNPPKGQRIEIQPSYRSWLSKMNLVWKEGAVLTIDYGGTPEEIYHRRPEGAVRAYFRQNRVERAGIYQRIGKQDITLDVNFADLQDWGKALGWKMIDCISQREFLSKHGEKTDEMARSEAGEAFRVLHQRKSALPD